MDRLGADARLGQVLDDAVRAVLGAGKHEHLLPLVGADQVRQQFALAALVHGDHAVIDVIQDGLELFGLLRFNTSHFQ